MTKLFPEEDNEEYTDENGAKYSVDTDETR